MVFWVLLITKKSSKGNLFIFKALTFLYRILKKGFIAKVL